MSIGAKSTNLGRLRPDLVRLWRIVARIAACGDALHCPTITFRSCRSASQVGPCCRCRNRPMSVEVGPHSVEICRSLTDFGPNLAKSGPNFGPIVVLVGPNLANIGPNSAASGLDWRRLVEVGPISADFGPTLEQLKRMWLKFGRSRPRFRQVRFDRTLATSADSGPILRTSARTHRVGSCFVPKLRDGTQVTARRAWP